MANVVRRLVHGPPYPQRQFRTGDSNPRCGINAEDTEVLALNHSTTVASINYSKIYFHFVKKNSFLPGTGFEPVHTIRCNRT